MDKNCIWFRRRLKGLISGLFHRLDSPEDRKLSNATRMVNWTQNPEGERAELLMCTKLKQTVHMRGSENGKGGELDVPSLAFWGDFLLSPIE